jgi:hypothetical protein
VFARAEKKVLRDGGHGAKWTYLFRFDQGLGSKDRFSARYFSDGYHLDGVLNLKNLLTYADQADIHYYNSLLSETHIFNSHILNNLILSYQIENASRGPLPGAISVADLGVDIWQPAFKQINQIQVNGGAPNGFNVGDNPQGAFRRANYTLGDVDAAPPGTLLNRRLYHGSKLYSGNTCIANNCYSQTITEANMGGNGSYNSLQVSAEQRMRSGLTLLANYTWSKAIDNTAYNQSSTAIAANNSYVLPIYEPNFNRLDRGPSDFDHRNVASISFVYVLPTVMKDAPGAIRYLVNNWQASGLSRPAAAIL